MKSLIRVVVALGPVLLFSACGEIKTNGSPNNDAGGDTPVAAACAVACGANAACVDEAGVYACRCGAGFVGDGQTCLNINECAAGTSMCDPLTRCTDKSPLYECSACPAGTLDMDPGIGTKCQRDLPDSMQVLAPGAMAEAACGTTADSDLDGDGIDGLLSAAILVNGATGKDAEGYGRNPTRPLKTITRAILVADADPDRNQIYVASKDAAGAPISYAEAITLPRGIHLYGGYEADFKKRDPKTRTKVAPATGVPFTADYTQGDVGGMYVIEGFVFEAAAGVAGASSIAGVVQDEPAAVVTAADAGVNDAGSVDGGVVEKPEARVRIINTTFIAKNGGDGSDGKRPEAGLPGCPGKRGVPQTTVRTIGFESQDKCHTAAPGGYGGAASLPVGEDGGPSGIVPGGTGGKKSPFGPVCVCTPSPPAGDNGLKGGTPETEATTRPPAAAQLAGKVQVIQGHAVWVPATGTSGGKGAAGLGGSGGGASFGACAGILVPPGNLHCPSAPGSSGGSGGGGGEAGAGGEGGLGGGATIGLLVTGTKPSLACLLVTTANGGKGGRGGAGALGGKGGDGGKEGPPSNVINGVSGIGGPGGRGSDGRPGLAGQGGRGGLSIGVLLYSSVATGLDAVGEIDTNKITIGAPGLGGPEIIGTEPGYPGLPGVAQRALSLP